MSYFTKIHKQTDTRMWVNNPSIQDAKKALEAGAFACTTNPAFCSKLLKSDKEYLQAIIDELINDYQRKGSNEFDYNAVAIGVYQRATKPIMEVFMSKYEATGGKEGFVTMQDDPRLDQDIEHTIKNILSNAKLAPNYMAKIPVIEGGIDTIEECVKHNIPICATEVFAISQAITICEKYELACKRFNNTPPMYLTHISGIFDEYLGKVAKREGIIIDETVIKQAGISIARKQYKIIKERGYNVTMLGGGARGIHHFIEVVGGPHITMNWSMIEQMLDTAQPIENTINKGIDEKAVEELSNKFDVFCQSFEEDGLDVKDYATFGPVQLFRDSFLQGWYILLAEIAQRRNLRSI